MIDRFRIPAAALAALLLALPSSAQSGPTVSTRLERGVLKMGQRTVLLIQLEGADQARLGDVPAVDGLRIGAPSSPSREFFSSTINGRRTTSVTLTWSVPIRPEREGEYVIPPVPIVLGNSVLETRPQRLTVVQDMRGEELGFLEVGASATRLVHGQVFTVEVVFGWDAALTQIDYADLSLGFWDGMPGLLEVETGPPPPGTKVMSGVLVNGREEVQVEQLAPRVVDDRRFHAFRLARDYVATQPGSIELPPAFLNFAATERSGGFFDTRRRKVEDYYAGAPSVYLEIEELPEEGRPFEFTGAIGTMTAAAKVDRRDVDAGDSLKLTVTWEGEANFEFFDAPDVARDDDFAGFRVYGRTDDREPGRREVVYDLAPLSDEVEEIPPVKLSAFDPVRREYVTVASDPIPIRVRALEGAVELDGEHEVVDARDLRDIDTRPLGPIGTGGTAEVPPPDGLVLAVLFGVPIGWICLRTLVRRRGDPAAPLERRRRRARRDLARALARAETPEDELEAVLAFLAHRTRSTETAWVGRDVERALRPRVEDEAERARTLVERLENAVWGHAGAGARVGKDEILRVADALIARGL